MGGHTWERECRGTWEGVRGSMSTEVGAGRWEGACGSVSMGVDTWGGAWKQHLGLIPRTVPPHSPVHLATERPALCPSTLPAPQPHIPPAPLCPPSVAHTLVGDPGGWH